MKMLFVILTSLLSVICQGQMTETGVKFIKFNSWEEVVAKATQEDKFIFLDCYTTWCGPCKLMDKTVFSNDSVGTFINKEFISVKIQMDTSALDDSTVVKNYGLAHFIKTICNVNGFPTYLFFSPDGKIVHKGMGRKEVNGFLDIASDARKKDKQLFTLIDLASSNRLSCTELVSLAYKLKDYREDSISLLVARNYMEQCLLDLPDTSFLTRDNILFFSHFSRMLNTSDRIFKTYIDRPILIDSIMSSKNFALKRADYIFTAIELTPLFRSYEQQGKEPRWDLMLKLLEMKFGIAYSLRRLNELKIEWYRNNLKWQKYIRLLISNWNQNRVEFTKYGWVYLNYISWSVCVYSNEKKQLRYALDWINLAINKESDKVSAMLDTKANLLYKLGLVEEAIKSEKEAVEIARRNSNAYEVEYYEKLISMMESRKPIMLSE